jgi:hypothetical protein
MHDLCTRNHRRKHLRDLVADAEEYRQVDGPWSYKLSDSYYDPAITAEVEKMMAEEQSTSAEGVYQSRVDRFR